MTAVVRGPLSGSDQKRHDFSGYQRKMCPVNEPAVGHAILGCEQPHDIKKAKVMARNIK